jgi:predicted phage terminase large subunit-like protein
MALAGRGFGKTKLGAQQVLRWVDQTPGCRIHIIAPTTADTRDVIVDGDSGILNSAHPQKRPLYEPSKRRLTFPNGSIALLYSAEEPERLRGPQCHYLWCDELAAWSDPQATWDQAMFGLRLGKKTQAVITTTPKPLPLIRSLLDKSRMPDNPHRIFVTSGTTYENIDNLASTFFTAIAQYEGTRLGRQELHAELIDPAESGIIRLPWLLKYPADKPVPTLAFVLQSYDTAFTEKTLDSKSKDPDPSACITLGVFRDSTPPYQHKILILDCWTDHLSYPDLRAKALREFQYAYGPESESRKPDIILIEDKGSGISLRQELQRAGLPVRPYNPGRADKLQRLHAVSHIPAHSLLYIPESPKSPGQFTSWSAPLIEQLTQFPLVKHDDLVDAFSQALLYLSDSGWITVDLPDETPEEKDYTHTRDNPYSI